MAPFTLQKQMQKRNILRLLPVVICLLIVGSTWLIGHRSATKLAHVYGLGSNKQFELGNDSSERIYTDPTALNFGSQFDTTLKSVVAGDGYTLLLTTDGTVYGLGTNQDGQIQPKSKDATFVKPVKVDLGLEQNEHVVQLSTKAHHALALTSKNRVLAWGSNHTSQLSSGGPEDRLQAVKIPDSQSVTKVTAGWRHSAVLTKSGRIYAWGGVCNTSPNTSIQEKQTLTSGIGGYFDPVGGSSGTEGDCNQTLAASFIQSAKPTRIGDDQQQFIDADLGYGHIVALTNQGNVYTSGCNLFGQLGRDSRRIDSSTLQFERSDLLSSIPATAIAAGYRDTYVLRDSTVWYLGLDMDVIASAQQAKNTDEKIYGLEDAKRLKARIKPAELLGSVDSIVGGKDMLAAYKKDSSLLHIVGRRQWQPGGELQQDVQFPGAITLVSISPNKVLVK